jgi:ArsR family transcriptional regulator, arsenate/arsenite/antimonite-responsive transcriptional repressor
VLGEQLVTKIPLQLLECAPTPGTEPLARTSAESIADLLKAVADPTRLQILAMIAQSDQQEACVCNLTEPLKLSQPTISHHLKKLNEVGVIDRERRGTWVWYSLNKARWAQIANLFE